MNNLSFYRTVRGAPALVLLILVIERRQLSLTELCHLAKYDRRTLYEAFRTLGFEGLDICSVSVRDHGEQYIAMGSGGQKLLFENPDVQKMYICGSKELNNNDQPLIDINRVNESLLLGTRCTLNVHLAQNPSFDECLHTAKRLGIGDPSATQIANSRHPETGDWMTPALITAHVKGLKRPQEKIGLAIHRLKDWQAIETEPVKKTTEELVAEFMNRKV
jgi:hypothetical protein